MTKYQPYHRAGWITFIDGMLAVAKSSGYRQLKRFEDLKELLTLPVNRSSGTEGIARSTGSRYRDQIWNELWHAFRSVDLGTDSDLEHLHEMILSVGRELSWGCYGRAYRLRRVLIDCFRLRSWNTKLAKLKAATGAYGEMR
jgi:hypothetical protein